MNKDFIEALEEIEASKGIEKEVIFDALEKALIKAYERNYEDQANVVVSMDRESGEIIVSALKEVVEEVEKPIHQISLEEAREISGTVAYGDELAVPVVPKNFGRIAAQTAKNIVIQTLRDAERQVIYEEFKDLEREIINGTVQRIDYGSLYIDIGRMEGVVPLGEQIPGEEVREGQRLKLFVKEVRNTTRGPQVILSRSDQDFVTRLLELEVPEIYEGVVEIYSIAREAGSRTKLAVFANEESIDPVGACVGYQGQRIRAIVDELGGEKLDIIVYDKDPIKFLSNALSPSDVTAVFIDQRNKMARILVPEDQLSLAIGKEGQNVRLAAKLTSWKIDIKGDERYLEAIEAGDMAIEFEGEVEFLESIEADIPPATLEAWEEKKKTPLEKFTERLEQAQGQADDQEALADPESEEEDLVPEAATDLGPGIEDPADLDPGAENEADRAQETADLEDQDPEEQGPEALEEEAAPASQAGEDLLQEG